jgi:hypothetical protein
MSDTDDRPAAKPTMDHLEAAPAPLTLPNGAGIGYQGLPFLYSYDNLQGDAGNNSCGQGAMATMADYYGKNPYNLPRQTLSRMIGDPQPGYHFDGQQLVSAIYRQFPPSFGIPGFPSNWKMTVREDFHRAFGAWGIGCQEGYKGALDNGDNVRSSLQLWLQRRPAIVLMDMSAFPGGSATELHWAPAFAYDNNAIWLSCWGSNPQAGGLFAVPWASFMKSWWCGMLPYPNNCFWLAVG